MECFEFFVTVWCTGSNNKSYNFIIAMHDNYSNSTWLIMHRSWFLFAFYNTLLFRVLILAWWLIWVN